MVKIFWLTSKGPQCISEKTNEILEIKD